MKYKIDLIKDWTYENPTETTKKAGETIYLAVGYPRFNKDGALILDDFYGYGWNEIVPKEYLGKIELIDNRKIKEKLILDVLRKNPTKTNEELADMIEVELHRFERELRGR